MKSVQSILQKIVLSSAVTFGCGFLPCSGNDSNCGEGEICVENACVPQESGKNKSDEENDLDSIFSQQVYANAQGEASIYSPRGDFTFEVKDLYSGEPLPATTMNFMQGEGFSLLTLGKEGYVQQLDIIPPDSSPVRDRENKRVIGLLPSNQQHVLIFDYYFSSHQEEVLTLNNYQQWAEDAYIFQGCVTREELEEGREYTMALISLVSAFGPADYFKLITKVYGALLEAGDLGILNTLPYEKYKVYEPLNFTAPPLFEGVVEESDEEPCPE